MTPLQLNSFGVIPKSNGKLRLITDLSFHRDARVNDLIPDSEAEVSYAGLKEAIDLVMKLGKGTMLAKFELKRAYQLLPVWLEDRWLLGMRWKGQFFLDLAPGGGFFTMGETGMCASFGCLWPENSGIGVSFYWEISVIGVHFHSEFSGIGVYCYTQNSVMGVE